MAAIPQQSSTADLPAPETETQLTTIPDNAAASHKVVLSERPLVNTYIRELENSLGHLDQEGRLALLTRWYADLRATAVHEFLFNRIFGSQVALLSLMNQSGGAITRVGVQMHFSGVVAANPGSFNSEGLDNYLHFLTTHNVSQWIDGKFTLTELGKDFLLYIVMASLNPAARPL